MRRDRRAGGARIALALAGLLAVTPLPAAAPSPALEKELRQIFESREYAVHPFGPARWLDGGRSYTTLEPSPRPKDAAEKTPENEAKEARDIVAYDTASGKRQVLVPSSRLVPSAGAAPLQIDDYAWSADRSRLIVFTNTKKVWRQNTRGDYWVLDLCPGGGPCGPSNSPDKGRLRKLGGGAAESSLMFARLSPDGSKAAYVRANNLYAEDLATGAITALTADGSETTINGTSDWVSEEELGLREAFRWSPDSRQIAYWQFDTTGVSLFTLIDDTDALYPTVKQYPYPKAGTTNSAVRVGVVSAAGGSTRWIAVPGDPRNFYIPRLEWAGSGALVLEHLNRLQNSNDLLLADLATGQLSTVFHDESKTWLDINAEIRPLEGGRSFLWESEKDGWRHVYRVARDGRKADLVTRFEGDVLRVDGVDEPGGWLYFSASPENATQRYLYRSRLDGSGGVSRVTPPGQAGSHVYDLSPDRRWAFHTFSRFDEPPATHLVRLQAHTDARVLADDGQIRAKAAALLERPVEFFELPIGAGVVLDGWTIKPREFDPAKKYPLVVFVYGEPAGQTVLDRWSSRDPLFHRALANDGYIVASFDNRGTPAPKGAAWRKLVYGAVGDVSSKDQAAAVKAFAAGRPYVDADRVAIWGWSGGGSSTLNAMFRFPDVYKVGVAVASVPDQRLYDTIYQERYMGLPDQNTDGYRVGSPISFAEGLKGKLLLVHGSGDDNVHYQGAERLVNRLIELGKPFDEMVYPNRSHAISEGKGTSLHVHQLIARYIRENLPAGGR